MHKITFMKHLTRCSTLSLALLSPGISSAQCVAPSIGCTGSDRTNAYINSLDPSTIEYDNIISLFHSTMTRQEDGRILVWGEKISASGTGNVLLPQELNATNYLGLTGEILKFSGGSRANSYSNHFVLTTDGLFFWGEDSWGIATGKTFQKLTIGGRADGLPAGVNPADVKMLFGTSDMQCLVTCEGAAYTLVAAGNNSQANAYGDGSSFSAANNAVWHRVKIDNTTHLENVVAVRGNGQYTFVALTATGKLYTWGRATFKGDGSATASRDYATQMTQPAGIIVKMIGMTAAPASGSFSLPHSSYYVLATNGDLYALGANNYRQLGDFSTTTRTSWVRVQRSGTPGDYLSDVVWISPNEHDMGGTGSNITPAINVLTADTVLYAWGSNDRQMLGGPSYSATINPRTNLGGLSAADKIVAVETGGHTTMTIRKCSNYFGYVGHKIGGSMADSTNATADVPVYSFETSQLNVCGASSEAATLFPIANAEVGQTYSLIAAPAGGTFTMVDGPATVDPVSGVLNITGIGMIEVEYSITGGPCPSATRVSFLSIAPLSVKWVDFTATKDKQTVVLEWITAGEEYNKGFGIERSADGKTWQLLSFKPSQAIDGNSTGSIAYSYVDTDPGNGDNLYRLKQVDLDGKYEYSKIIKVQFKAKNTISISPIPATDRISIRGIQGDEIITLYSTQGKEVIKVKATGTVTDISLQALNKGLYYITIQPVKGEYIYEKVIKQ